MDEPLGRCSIVAIQVQCGRCVVQCFQRGPLSLGLFPNWAERDPKNALENAKEAMELAERWLGIPQVSNFNRQVSLNNSHPCYLLADSTARNDQPSSG